jgi:hypothetical protein
VLVVWRTVCRVVESDARKLGGLEAWGVWEGWGGVRVCLEGLAVKQVVEV